MPTTVRLKPVPPGKAQSTVVLRPALTFAGVTRFPSGIALPQAYVTIFRSATDQMVARELSDGNARYSTSVPDTDRYYAVAFQAGTADTSRVTADNTFVKVDRTTGIGGVTDNTLKGNL